MSAKCRPARNVLLKIVPILIVDDIWLLSRDTLGEERDELARRGATIAYRKWTEVSVPLADFPAVARWMMDIQEMTFQLSFMEELERCGTRVINTPRAVQTCDKASIYFLWNWYLKDRIDMPPTIMTAPTCIVRSLMQLRSRSNVSAPVH